MRYLTFILAALFIHTSVFAAVELDGDSNGAIDLDKGGTNSPTAAGARSNLGLGNIDNTSDANKPISTVTQNALDLKAEKPYVNTTAPADLTLDWYDTDQEPGVYVHKKHNGTTWVRVGSHGIQYLSNCSSITAGMCVDTDDGKLYYHNNTSVIEVGTGSGSYTLPTASADTLGGVKVGSRLTITDGVLSADVQSGTGVVDSVNGQTGTVVIDTIAGNAGSATVLQTARTIGGVGILFTIEQVHISLLRR